MVLANFIILLSIFQYGHCLTLTLEDFDNWKKLMKAELKEEIFVELPETEEIKRMNKKIQEFTKTNEEIVTVVQSQSIKLDSFQANIENLTNQINQLANRIEVLDENHKEVQNITSSMKASLDKLKSNHVEDQTETNDHFGELENDLNGLEVNLNESELILKNHTDQIVQLKTSIDQLNESELILKNHTDQTVQLKRSIDKLNESELILKNHTDQIVQLKTSIDKLNESELILKIHTDQIVQLKTSIDKLEVEQNETKGLIKDLHPIEGTQLNCNFY